MLIFNTTYTMPTSDAQQFVIWVHQCMIPQVHQDGALSHGKLLRVLTHQDQQSECFSLQFEVEDSATLHRWYTRQGVKLNEEMLKIFDKRMAGFSTIMEVIEEN